MHYVTMYCDKLPNALLHELDIATSIGTKHRMKLVMFSSSNFVAWNTYCLLHEIHCLLHELILLVAWNRYCELHEIDIALLHEIDIVMNCKMIYCTLEIVIRFARCLSDKVLLDQSTYCEGGGVPKWFLILTKRGKLLSLPAQFFFQGALKRGQGLPSRSISHAIEQTHTHIQESL
jgi:hypothetical protein